MSRVDSLVVSLILKNNLLGRKSTTELEIDFGYEKTLKVNAIMALFSSHTLVEKYHF